MATNRKRVVIYLTPEQAKVVTALAGGTGHVSKFISKLLIEQLTLSGKPPERGKYARVKGDADE